MTYRFNAIGGLVREADGASIPPDALNRDYRQYLAWRALGNEAKPHRYQVTASKTITRPTGVRYIVKGVTMFDYLFVSFEYRSNRLIREVPGMPVTAGGSRPTGFAPLIWASARNIDNQIRTARNSGVTHIRVPIEPAMVNSTGYTLSGSTWPSDLAMLDHIIDAAFRFGVVVQLHASDDHCSVSENIAFLEVLAARYGNHHHVWICPRNEINCAGVWTSPTTHGPNPACNNVTTWTADTAAYVSAIRTAGFKNPIVINPTSWGYGLNAVASSIAGNATLANDPNLVIGVHVYCTSEAAFTGARQAEVEAQIRSHAGSFCIFFDEVGIDNFEGRFDPNLDAGVPSSNATRWAQLQTWAQQFVAWTKAQNSLNGMTATMWFGYIPGITRHDDNTLRKQDGSWSTWGAIYRDGFLN